MDSLTRRGYKLQDKIGNGAYSKVVRATYCKASGAEEKQLVCKIVEKKDEYKKFLDRELEALATLRHPYIIEMQAISANSRKVFIFMDYAANGDVLAYIKQHTKVDETQARIWFKQMSSAVRYMHELNFAHRDLKCENLFICASMNIKVGDFGFSRFCLDEDFVIFSNTFCGSEAYVCPEIRECIPYDSKKADMWALGVILYAMVTGVMPFNTSNLSRTLKDQKAGNYHQEQLKDCSSGCKKMIKAMLQANPEKRIDVEDIFTATWMRDW